ncbi:MAG TPA: hypothetical protein VN783_13600, partial [Thermoanaerobaculia bacterium]|nr:hypothetical protein [Thermoanaerobaculia bacterium]
MTASFDGSARRSPARRPAERSRTPAPDGGGPGPLWHRLATSAGPLQAKLAVNTPGDAHEQEADRVADQVLRMPDPAAPGFTPAPPAIQRLCSHCEEEEKVQRACAHCEEEEKIQRALPKEEEDEKLQKKEAAGGGVPAVSPGGGVPAVSP